MALLSEILSACGFKSKLKESLKIGTSLWTVDYFELLFIDFSLSGILWWLFFFFFFKFHC